MEKECDRLMGFETDRHEIAGVCMQKKSQKYLMGVGCFFLIFAALILIVNLYRWNAKRTAEDSLPMPFGLGASVIVSDGMEPALSVNDLVIIKKEDSYGVNDVVAYQSEEKLIIHRIVFMDGDKVMTRGDAIPVPDIPIQTAEIKGELVCRIPFVGLLVRILETPAGTIGIFAISFCLLGFALPGKKYKMS
jgi:signal peptidase I